MELHLLFLVLFLVLVAEFINGWTDAPNAIATVISTRTLSPRIAILSATILNIAGAFSGKAVAETIAVGIVKPEMIDLTAIATAVSAIILWGITSWWLGLPISKSHALMAGLGGSAVASGGFEALIPSGWMKILLGLVLSTCLGSLCGWLIAKIIQLTCSDANPTKAKKIFAKLQVLSSCSMAFSHGSNDGQKFIGIFSLALFLGGIYEFYHVSMWVVVICSLVMGLGTSIGGFRIIRTMGYKIVHLETYQGFAAETAAASIIMVSSFFGVPLSTTHTISTAIVGVGIAQRPKAVQWKVVINIIYAWLLTFPICGMLAYLLTKLIR